MKNKDKDIFEYFELKPIKAAKVSEISETTATSSAAPQDRVNFHIGNPVQDLRLYSAYLRIILDLGMDREDLNENTKEQIFNELGWEESDRPKIDFFIDLIKNSSPYLPRGGYLKENPSYLIKYFNDWLQKYQQEPLSYDLGNLSGRREIILSAGGINESLRVLFHSLANYLACTPAKIFIFGADIPDHLYSYQSLRFIKLPDDEESVISILNESLGKEPHIPAFIILGKIPKEDTRRTLRTISRKLPLFFIETNNAPNHLSLAREAKMMNNVLRFLTPAIFSPSLKNLSLLFICGNPDFIKIIETVHFQLKGTPSASEVELLSYILKMDLHRNAELEKYIRIEPTLESFKYTLLGQKALIQYVNDFDKKTEKLTGIRIDLINKKVKTAISNIEHFTKKSWNKKSVFNVDTFSGHDIKFLFEELIKNLDSSSFCKDLTSSLLGAFISHHPEYKFDNSCIVSGSARSALGLLGFNCGIKEVIIPDLSWTYEHCFPSVQSVPLTSDYELDVDGIIASVEEKIVSNPEWRKSGAVAINNPHNATGQYFNESELKKLVQGLLERKIFIIDDLSYQNVAPVAHTIKIKTVRELADELLNIGLINEEHSKYVISVHSLSKTDCLAGSRMCIVNINHEELFRKFIKLNDTILPNISAIFLTYLFYRSRPEITNAYWNLRNKIFYERMSAISEAAEVLPKERNTFGIEIIPAKASMYPRMVINKLPDGLSLDWLASNLARQGIGMVPLTTFARTESGFEIARKSFRLTLGGKDDAETLRKKTRRVIIDLNRMIAEESANYNIHQVINKKSNIENDSGFSDQMHLFGEVKKRILRILDHSDKKQFQSLNGKPENGRYFDEFQKEFLPEKLDLFYKRYHDKLLIRHELKRSIESAKYYEIIQKLEAEFYKDNLERREEAFKKRLYDRTVHPTQMYSIKTELVFRKIIENLIKNSSIQQPWLEQALNSLVSEYIGTNVAINSSEESDEIILDLDSLLDAENYSEIFSEKGLDTFLSFWGDWDGSNRPSGQGHRLISSVLIENVVRESRLLKLLLKSDKSTQVDPHILGEMENLSEKNKNFRNLLNEITLLTHQLEKRYKGILPFNIKPGKIRQIGMNLHVAKDPVTSLWYHNDRLERKMLQLREKRKSSLEYYFSLNKKLRKTLHSLLPSFRKNLNNPEIYTEAFLYKDLLRRFVLTPRIHQNLITAQDQFAIDTTIHNIQEINEISGKYGNPGMILSLQVSMSTKSEAVILLDRKIKARREQSFRENDQIEVPYVSAIPLFEDSSSVTNIKNYLNKIWEYALQSRKLNQETSDRFGEIITEVFIAGSDLSQQIGQAAGLKLYKEAKLDIIIWLAERDLIDKVRIKMGSGEAMQRQGGYYSYISGKKAFFNSPDTDRRFSKYLDESTKKSTRYAITPLMGIFAGGDLRTFQSNLSEKLRYLSVRELSELLIHIRESQKFLKSELIRASDPLRETRLQFQTHGLQELERLTIGSKDNVYDEFISIFTENFRHILYGREEDVVGIHIISYFIARTIPTLRDRPTVRPGKGVSGQVGQKILEKIAETIPFSRYGSLLRAIAHNQAQTMTLGINQLTTGLFRTLDIFAQKQFIEGDASVLIMDRILPNLPVYEILHSVRIYHDVELNFLNKIERAFPAGNTAFLILREDIDSLKKYIPLFQRELLRRHGLNVNDFFDGDVFISDLLPTLRPDLAVLLQSDLFNTDENKLLSEITGNYDSRWFEEIVRLLKIPVRIGFWRFKAWELLEKPIFQRVESFVELALALNSISSGLEKKEFTPSPKKLKLSSDVKNYFKISSDDTMQQYVAAAYEYLSSISETMVEVPINIIRALREVERIIKIEEQALSVKDQNMLRFYLLQIARIAGDNG